MAVGEAFLSAFLQVLFDRLASRDFFQLLFGRRYDDLLENLKMILLCLTTLLSDAEEKQFYSSAVQKWLNMAKDALYDAEDILDELATEALKCELEAESRNTGNQKARHSSYIRTTRDMFTKFDAFIGVECLRTFLPLDPLDAVGVSYLDGFSNLVNLRHLQISESRLKEMPLQMGRLKNLCTLSHFIVGKDGGSGIRELRYMLQLRGTLLISGLQNLVSYTDAMDANLKNKKQLDQLVLNWSNNILDTRDDTDEEELSNARQLHREQEDPSSQGKISTRFPSFKEYLHKPLDLKFAQRSDFNRLRNERVETEALGMLEPHKNIRKLVIKDYGGNKFPRWVGCSSFSKLTHLELSNCTKCQYLPPLGQLPSLKELAIEGMERIQSVGAEFYQDGCSYVPPFPVLDNLRFENMSGWEEWFSSGNEGVEDFRNLKKIKILNCPKLRKISPLFPSLQKMNIWSCNELRALPKIPSIDSLQEGREFPCLLELSIRTCPKLWELPSSFPSLQVLEMDGCPELMLLPKLPSIHELELRKCDQGLLQSIVGLSSLAYLRMSHISELTCLDHEFFKCLEALEELQMAHFGELATLSLGFGYEKLSYLQRLEISGCPYLTELPQNFCKLARLKELRVCSCPSLLSFPETGFPPGLLGLEIKDCEALELLPEWLMNNHEVPFLLECLVIESCSSLASLPNGRMPRLLKQLEIKNCRNLEYLPEEIIQNNRSLEFLTIVGCHALRSFPEGAFALPAASSTTAMKIKQLVIQDCSNLASLPGGLHNLIYLDHLEIEDCPLLLSFPEPGLPASKLLSIKISNCRNLRSLPNRMSSLTSLEELCIDGCSRLVSFPEGGLPTNLTSLSILDCENLKPSCEWGLHRLGCLTDFSFGGCQDLVSFPEDCLFPSNISSLHLQRLPNLKSLPNGVQSNTSLETLDIWECNSLQTLPEEEPLEMCLNLGYLNVL
ncbi:hypothetical protein HS088_TW21G01511 [Tripterygium wilfordii]|uniref:Rx N-terminal domain-containing protein n=1 Tax=Tripterygium wilfordii TaxID=458696 RepID=A0A7J7C6F9_TRIWF|nr:hypothetical protein HS088_TW21G01511 [Tripterygium wilfordii]